MAHAHASDVHLGAFVSQNHNGTDHWIRLAVQADVSSQVQTHATPLTVTMLLYHPHPHWQHHGIMACNLESAICVAMLYWFLNWAREMV